MCRMLLACGKFSVTDVLKSAVSMSQGETASHDAPIKKHIDGWGAVWYDAASPTKLSVFRSPQSIEDSFSSSPLSNLNTHFLAIHVRHATISHQIGINYNHPITCHKRLVPWYMLHNGFLPTIFEKLQLEKSNFDSREYFEYIVPKEGDVLDSEKVLDKLDLLTPEGTSGNCFIINPRRFYVVNWRMKHLFNQNYYNLCASNKEGRMYVASEVQLNLAPQEAWSVLPLNSITGFSLDLV